MCPIQLNSSNVEIHEEGKCTVVLEHRAGLFNFILEYNSTSLYWNEYLNLTYLPRRLKLAHNTDFRLGIMSSHNLIVPSVIHIEPKIGMVSELESARQIL